MDFVELHADVREEKGTQLNKKLRKKGIVPGIVYKKAEDSVPLKLDRKSLSKAIHTSSGENVIIKLFIDDVKKKKERIVVIKEIQRDPVKDAIMHVDFNEISLTEMLTVKVPIVSKGEAPGVKQEGGVLQHVLWELEIECLPTNIPDKIEVDISDLKIGSVIMLRDIKAPERVKVLGDPEAVVFSVEHVKTVEEAVAAPPEAEVLEPEVIKEKKEKPEEEEEAPKEEKKKEEKKEEKK